MAKLTEHKTNKKHQGLLNQKFIISNISKEKLYNLGFRQTNYEDIEDNNWTYIFPVCNETLICSINVEPPSKEVKLNVYIDYNKHNIYPPFYQQFCGNHLPVLNKINNDILNEFKKLNIKPVQPKCLKKGVSHVRNNNHVKM